MDYYIDNAKVNEAMYAPFTFDWLSTVGNHTVSAVAYDAAGNHGVSNVVAVSVPAKITVISPTENGIVSGVLTNVDISLSDPVQGWTSLYIDGNFANSLYFENGTTTINFTCNWDTTQYVYGSSHYIEVAGSTQSGGIWTYKKFWVTVDNTIPIVDTSAPRLSITSPSNDSTVGPSGEIVPIIVSTVDNVGVTRVDYYIDNAKVSEAVYAPFTLNWLSTVGNHTVSAVAYDAADNFGFSNVVDIMVPTKVTVTSPGCRFQSYLSVEFQPSVAVRSGHFPKCMTF